MFSHIYKTSPSGEGLLYAWFEAMHTRVDMALCGRLSEEELLPLAKDVQAEILRLEMVGNRYNERSELAFVNRTAAQRPVEVGEDLYRMVELCLHYHAATFGCFDVTADSEGYDAKAPTNSPRGGEQRDAEVSISSPSGGVEGASGAFGTISFSRPGICIDLSGFLKGYALEAIRPLLKRAGIANALISLGNSSVLALGHHPMGNGWKLTRELTLTDRCLTVSGNDTEERKHIISPANGRLVEGKRRVAVVTDNAAWGEALSTALFAATPEQRTRLIQAFGLSSQPLPREGSEMTCESFSSLPTERVGVGSAIIIENF